MRRFRDCFPFRFHLHRQFDRGRLCKITQQSLSTAHKVVESQNFVGLFNAQRFGRFRTLVWHDISPFELRRNFLATLPVLQPDWCGKVVYHRHARMVNEQEEDRIILPYASA